MSNFNYHYSDTNNVGGNGFMVNLILIIISFGSEAASDFTIDEAYKWLWRLASLLSLFLLMYINFHKAKEIYKNNKKNGW